MGNKSVPYPWARHNAGCNTTAENSVLSLVEMYIHLCSSLCSTNKPLDIVSLSGAVFCLALVTSQFRTATL